MTPESIHLLLVDDHPLMRDGLRLRLEAVPGFVVVGEAGNAIEALLLAERHRPQLVLTDIGMREANGITLTTRLHARHPDMRVLILSMHDELEYVRKSIAAGARGYVLKDGPASDIIAAIRAVMAGRVWYSPSVAVRMMGQRVGTMDGGVGVEPLTPRERDILKRIAEGWPNKRIAATLDLSVRTVESHRLNIKRKLDIDGQAQLVKYAVEQRGNY